MAIADLSDVEARLGRPMTPDERDTALVYLDDAELMLRSRIRDLLDRAAEDDDYRAAVRYVEAMMVVRILRNPSGFRREQAGDYSYDRDTRAAAGFMLVLPDEWRLLGRPSGAFTINPHLSVRRPPLDYCPWGWP